MYISLTFLIKYLGFSQLGKFCEILHKSSTFVLSTMALDLMEKRQQGNDVKLGWVKTLCDVVFNEALGFIGFV